MAHFNTFLSPAWRHVKISRYGQESLLIALGTSQYFHIRILELCLTWKVKVKKLLLIVHELGTSQYCLFSSLQI